MLYIVGTPIGNLKDITIRALNILRKVDYIFAEDTRTVKKLLGVYKIHHKKIKSYHKFNEIQQSVEIVELLKKNIDIALVSEAGTPLISDPGRKLIMECFKNQIKFIPVPGVSALTTILSVTPFENKEFVFVGFLEKNKNRKKKQILELLETGKNIFFFDSPLRILSTFEIICEIDENLSLIVGRELTKFFEEIIYNNVKFIYNYYAKNKPQGEFTVGIENKYKKIEDFSKDIELLRELNIPNKDIITFVSKKYKIAKSKIYNILNHEKNSSS